MSAYTAKAYWLIAFLLVVGAASCTGSTDPPPDRLARVAFEEDLQRVLDTLQEEVGSPGVQASVILEDGTVWSGASGFADTEQTIPVTTDTRFAMGSSMKFHTTVLILDLAEDGLLSLDDPLMKWVPEFPGSSGITLRHLLLHTSGLASVAGSDIAAALDADPDHHLSYEELVLDPVCRPGRCYWYQSPDYGLLGEVVERVTGHPLASEIHARLWDPLGLDDTYFPSQEDASGSMATGYGFGPPTSAADVATCDQEDVDDPYPCAGGGLLSTTTDMARFSDAVLSGGLLDDSSVEQLLDFEATEDLPGISECGAVGLGLVRDGSPDHGQWWGHGGFTGNFHSGVAFYPRFGATLAVTVNDDGDTARILDALLDVVSAEVGVVDPRSPGGFCNFDIYAMRSDGSRRVRLTTDPGSDGSSIAWSPDGESIAFGSLRTGDTEIFVMNADGRDERNLTNDPADDAGASWSPDGTKIAFHSDRDGSNDIFVMNSDGSGVAQLTSGLADDVVPAWSPDGTKIAFASGTADSHDVYVMDADGSDAKRLTSGETDEWWPSWSPDGSRIAFVIDRRLIGGGGIGVLTVKSGALNAPDLSIEGPNFPAWSSTGRIALLDFFGDIWTVDPNGSDPVRLTRTGEREFQPSWSFDGRWLAFPGERWVEE